MSLFSPLCSRWETVQECFLKLSLRWPYMHHPLLCPFLFYNIQSSLHCLNTTFVQTWQDGDVTLDNQRATCSLSTSWKCCTSRKNPINSERPEPILCERHYSATQDLTLLAPFLSKASALFKSVHKSIFFSCFPMRKRLYKKSFAESLRRSGTQEKYHLKQDKMTLLQVAL